MIFREISLNSRKISQTFKSCSGPRIISGISLVQTKRINSPEAEKSELKLIRANFFAGSQLFRISWHHHGRKVPSSAVSFSRGHACLARAERPLDPAQPAPRRARITDTQRRNARRPRRGPPANSTGCSVAPYCHWGSVESEARAKREPSVPSSDCDLHYARYVVNT